MGFRTHAHVNPHNLFLTMFCPSSAHDRRRASIYAGPCVSTFRAVHLVAKRVRCLVLCFDPRFGVDTVRQYHGNAATRLDTCSTRLRTPTQHFPIGHRCRYAGKYCSKPEKWYHDTERG